MQAGRLNGKLFADLIIGNLCVGSIAEGRICRLLALAEESLAILYRSEGFGREVCSGMGPVTERSLARLAATAEVVFFSGLQLDRDRLVISYSWLHLMWSDQRLIRE